MASNRVRKTAPTARADPGKVKAAPPVALPEALVRDFEELGLSPYEALIVVALLRLGSANSLQLARVTGVPRTSIYQIMEGLTAKQLAERIPADGPAVWASPGRDEVLENLHAAQEERLRQHRLRTARVREALAEAFPEDAEVALPYVHLLHGTTQVERTYEQLWAEVGTEVLAFSRPPYAVARRKVMPGILDALAHGVVVRALYESSAVDDPGAKAYREEIEAYINAGVDARVVDQLPIKLILFDRTAALVALTGPLVEVGYPTNLLINHQGFAEVQADAFEVRWQTARAYEAPAAHGADTGGTSDAEKATAS